jgi:hypothetical protein
MIEMPRRSVTRFFIPLIDVLTLLFCIFLLMPIVRATTEAGEGAAAGPGLTAQERQDLERLRREKEAWQNVGNLTKKEAELRETLQSLRREKLDTLAQRLAIRVLEIDRDKLYYYDPNREADRRVEITKETVARFLAEQKRTAGDRDLYLLILYPRRASGLPGYPTKGQIKEYEAWFKDVAHSYDIPYRLS